MRQARFCRQIQTMADLFLWEQPISGLSKDSSLSFTALESVARLRVVQQIVHSRVDIDAILCILGVDSKFCDESRKAINFLIFGHSGRQLDNLSLGFDDDVTEDVVIMIRSNSVDVYCNPVNAPILLPVISHWPNLQLYCLQKEEFEDGDFAEDFKIRSFLKMSAKSSAKMGIPFGMQAGKKFDPMLIERWPLIQSYALEDYGSGGFFTMHHKVIDIANAMAPLYESLDSTALLHIVTCVLPLLERQFNSVMQNVDIASDISTLRENCIGEPLSVYFAHGLGIQPSSDSASRAPLLLAGQNSSRHVMESLPNQVKGKMSGEAIGTLGLNGETATHMVCECSDPKGALSCSRTYFFRTGFLPGLGERTDLLDAELLTAAYHLMIQSVSQAIDVYAKTLRHDKAKEACLQHFEAEVKKRKIALGVQFLRDNAVFSLWACDSHGRQFELVDGKFSSVIKTARLTIYNIPSIQFPGKSAGSLMYGDSFVSSVISSRNSDETISQHSMSLSLTHCIPPYVAWPGAAEEVQGQLNVADLLKGSTQKLLDEEAYLVFSDESQQWLKGKLTITDQLIAFKAPHFGYMTFPLKYLVSLHLYNAGSSSAISLLLLRPSSCLPFLCRQSTVALALMPSSPAHRSFYKHVSPVWKAVDPPLLDDLSDLPDEFQNTYDRLGFHYQLNARGSSIQPIDRAQDRLPQLDKFVAHLEASSCLLGRHVSAIDLPVAMGYTPEPWQPNKISVSVIAGVPGSGKHQLSQTLVSLDKEETRWIVLRQPLDSCDDFDPESLQSSLSSIVAKSQRRSSLSNARKRTRILMVTPGATAVKEVIQAIIKHPETVVKDSLSLGAVTCCVDLKNCCMETGDFFPNLLANCSSGLVDTIVWTTDKESEVQCSWVEQLIQACNPSATFIHSPMGKLLTEEHLKAILSQSSFMSPAKHRIRLLLHPDMLEPVLSASMPFQSVCLKFRLPLERRRFDQQISALKSTSLATVYYVRAKLLLTDSPVLHCMEFVRQSRHFTLFPDDNPIPTDQGRFENAIVFWGINLNTTWLKNWLKDCCKPAPQKKKQRTRNDLSNSEIREIQNLHKLDTLPEGHFFNGYQYVSFDGEKSDTHPLLEEFIGDFVAKENLEIERHNAEVVSNSDQEFISEE